MAPGWTPKNMHFLTPKCPFPKYSNWGRCEGPWGRTFRGFFANQSSEPKARCFPQKDPSKLTTSRCRTRSDACMVAYIAVDFRSESADRSEKQMLSCIALHKSLAFVSSKAQKLRDSHRGLQKHIASQIWITRFRDHRQITHLICVRLRHLLCDFFRGRFGPFI